MMTGFIRYGGGYGRISNSGLRGHSWRDCRGHVLDRAGAVEDTAGLDSTFEHVGQQFLDVGTNRRGTATDRGVLPERNAGGRRVLFWNADAPDGAARTGNRKRRSTTCPRPTHSSTEWAP